jgi:site-specific DNA recombinase
MIAAIYSRKSRLSEKGESVENQVQMCKEYLNRNYSNIEDIRIYEDEGFSGGNINRPNFKKLITDAKKNKFSVLICYRLDRISRSVADFSNTIEDLQKLNIAFISIKEQFDTGSPMGRAMMNTSAVFAQLERETIAERIKDNMLELAKTGRWLGGTAPLGYKSEPVEYDNKDGKSKKMFKLTEVPEEMQIVKLIYKLYLEKRGFASVATHLCKNKYKGKNGGEFSRGTVEQIIINPVYCIGDKKIFEWFEDQGANLCGIPNSINGLMVFNKRKESGKKPNPIDQWIVAVGRHEGVISSDVWLQCQNIFQENKLKISPRSGTGNKFLLSGMLVCDECKSGMASWSHYNKKREFMERYYRCNLRNRASNRCSNKMLNAYKAEEYVANYLLDLDADELIKAYNNETDNTIDKDDVQNKLNKLEKQLDDNNKIHKGLIRKFALMEDDPDLLLDLKNEINSIKKENNDLQCEISKLKNSMEKAENKDEFIEILKQKVFTFKKFYNSPDMDIESKRLLIKSIVNDIVWNSATETIEINPIRMNKKTNAPGAVRRRNI